MIDKPENPERRRIARRLYARMLVGSAAGGVLLCVAAWLRLKQLGYTGDNPFCGPPFMMICMGGAWLGMVLGAGVGVFSVVFGKGKDTQQMLPIALRAQADLRRSL